MGGWWLLWRASLRYHLSHPWQLGLALLGIGLGVAVVLAVDLANGSAQASFRLALEQVSGQSTHRLRAGDGPLAETLYLRLRRELGLQRAAPVVSGHAQLPAQPGKIVQVLGVDPLAEGVFRDFGTPVQTLGGPWQALLKGEPVALLGPDLGTVDSVELQAGGQRLRLRRLASLDASAMAGLVVVDIAVAQQLFQMSGQLSHIDLLLDEARDRALMARIESLLPAGVGLERTSERDAALVDLSRSFRLNLSAMSLLALLVGMFLIYNTMTFSVVQRRGLFGRMRVLGVSRQMLFGLLLGEVLLLGFLGLLLGTALGIWLATALTSLVTRTIDDLYYTLTVTRFQIPPLALAKALALGLGATVLAAWVPALEAANSPPALVLSRSSLEARWRRLVPWLGVGGLGLGLAGALMFALTDGLLAAFVGLFLWLLGLALLVPGSLLLVEWLLAPWLGFAPSWLRMAVRDVVRHLSRTGVAIAALAVAFAATVGVALMIESFRGGVSVWLEDLLSADFYVAPASLETGDPDTMLLPETVAALADTPGVANLARFANRTVMLGEQRALILGLAVPAQARAGYRLKTGDPATAWPALLAGEALLVSEPLAYHLDLVAGQSLEIPTPQGIRTLRIAGVFYDYASEHGRILMDLALFRQLWPAEPIRTAGVFAATGVTPQTLRARLEAGAGQIQPLAIRANRELHAMSLEIFERTFAITGVVRMLAVVIAFVGLLSSLLALSLERSRELAILRAIGMTPLEVARQLFAESAYQGLLAGILALPIGVVLAGVLIRVINRRAFGWTLPFELDPLLLAQTVLLALLAALLAALYPCYRLTRVEPATDLRGE